MALGRYLSVGQAISVITPTRIERGATVQDRINNLSHQRWTVPPSLRERGSVASDSDIAGRDVRACAHED